MYSEPRGRAALRKPVHIFVGCEPKRGSIGRYFDCDDGVPPTPSLFLRDIGVDWLRDPALPYGCYVICHGKRRTAMQLVKEAIREFGGGAYDRRAIRWIGLMKGRKFTILAIVQSDAKIRRRQTRVMKLVALGKNMRLFDADELATGSYCLVNCG
jgi:hypothetical protein